MSASFIARRLLHSIIVLFGILTLVFVLVRLIPADPIIIMAGPNASPEQIETARRAHGFDQPIYVQYVIYLGQVFRGDLGDSLRHHQPATTLVLESFPATALLAGSSMLLAIVIAVPAGVIAAMRRGSVYDALTTGGALLGQSVPTFWLGIVLIIVFAVWLQLLPTSGYGGVQHFILPTITLGFYMMALIARMSRSAMLDVLDADYLRTARAKGLPSQLVIRRHALRNAAIPVITVLGLQTGTLLGGAVITETVFAWPGIGSLAVDSINNLDYAVVQAVVILSGIIFVAINFLLDMLYVWIDPRIRYQ